MASLAFRLYKIQFQPGLRPDHGELTILPCLYSWLGREYSFPIPSTHSASRSRWSSPGASPPGWTGVDGVKQRPSV